jgi:hypothetical protein
MAYRMPFGRHKEIDVTEVPKRALAYYLDWDQLRPDARQAIEAELARRAQGGPSHPGGPGDRVVPDAIKSRAFDLIVAGLATLEREYRDQPAWLAQVRQAGELLRGWLRSANDAAARVDREDREVPF